LDRRVSGLHRSVGALSTDVGQNKTDIAVLKRDGEEMREDISDIKKVVEEEGKRNRASNNRLIGAVIALSVSAVGSAITFALTSGGHP
jgi:hypothetical protein